MNPLSTATDRIDPHEVYTSKRLAEVLGVRRADVSLMRVAGWLPDGKRRALSSTPGGARYETEWTGRQILTAARRREQPPLDHERYSPVTLWRIGCRCEPCTQAHNKETRARCWAAADAAFPENARVVLLAALTLGTPLPDAAAAVGVNPAQVYGRAKWDTEFSQALDEAGWGLCALGRTDARCSTGTAYRHDRCRGTGCREMRRESSRRERA